MGVAKALRWVLLWIMLGTTYMVKAVEEEISTRQETDCMLEKVPVLRAGDEIRWKRVRTCDRGWKEGEYWQKIKFKKDQEKDPKTFEENSQGKDPSTSEGRSQNVKWWKNAQSSS